MTYQEWLNASKNRLCENSFYTEDNVYRLWNDKTQKKLIKILEDNQIKDFCISINNDRAKLIKKFQDIGFKIEGCYEESKSKDYYFVR